MTDKDIPISAFKCRKCGKGVSDGAALERIGPTGQPAIGWQCIGGCGEQTLMTDDEKLLAALNVPTEPRHD